MLHLIVNANLVVQNCNSNQNGIAILASASVKNKTCSRKIMGHIFVRMVST